MQTVDTRELEELDQAFAQMLERAPALRREYHERVGDMLLQKNESAIGSSGIQDNSGRVRRWQVAKVGSGGGYAVLRASGSKEGAQTGRDGPGAVTNYLEGGHKHRSPSGKDARYRARIKVHRVPGHYFYRATRTAALAAAIQLAEDYAKDIVAPLEG